MAAILKQELISVIYIEYSDSFNKWCYIPLQIKVCILHGYVKLPISTGIFFVIFSVKSFILDTNIANCN